MTETNSAAAARLAALLDMRSIWTTYELVELGFDLEKMDRMEAELTARVLSDEGSR